MKVLFCGLGSTGQRHLRNLRKLLGNELEVLAFRQRRETPVLNADMTVKPGADVEREYDVRAFSDLDAALAERPDAVFVTNPNSLHMSVALPAARAGAHLFIEKPLSHSLEGVPELREIAEAQNLVVFVAYQFRFHPALKALRQILDDRKLGSLVAAHVVNGEYLPDWHPYEDYRQTHPARRELGGGALRIQTHEFDYVLWLFGMPTRVYAVGGHLSDLEVNVEDSVSVLLSCGSQDRPFPVHVHLDYVQRPPQRVCEVIGDAGQARYDYYASTLTVIDAETGQESVTRFDHLDRNDMFVEELRHFLACIRGEEQPLIDIDEADRSLQLSLAAAQSLETGQSVRLPYGR